MVPSTLIDKMRFLCELFLVSFQVQNIVLNFCNVIHDDILDKSFQEVFWLYQSSFPLEQEEIVASLT